MNQPFQSPHVTTQSMLQLDTQAFLEEEEQYAQLQRIRPQTAEYDYHNYNLISQNLRLFTENDNPSEVVIFSESLEDLLCIGLHRQSRDSMVVNSGSSSNTAGTGSLFSVGSTTTTSAASTPSPTLNTAQHQANASNGGGVMSSLLGVSPQMQSQHRYPPQLVQANMNGPQQQQQQQQTARYDERVFHVSSQQQQQQPPTPTNKNKQTSFYMQQQTANMPQQQQQQTSSNTSTPPTPSSATTIPIKQQQQQQPPPQQMSSANSGTQKFKFVNFNAPNDGISQDLLRQEQVQETMPAPVQKKTASRRKSSNTSEQNNSSKKRRTKSNSQKDAPSPKNSSQSSESDSDSMFGKFNASSETTITFMPFTQPNQKKR